MDLHIDGVLYSVDLFGNALRIYRMDGYKFFGATEEETKKVLLHLFNNQEFKDFLS